MTTFYVIALTVKVALLVVLIRLIREGQRC